MEIEWAVVAWKWKWKICGPKTLQSHDEVGAGLLWRSLFGRETQIKHTTSPQSVARKWTNKDGQVLCNENIEQKVDFGAKFGQICKNRTRCADLYQTSVHSGSQVCLLDPWKVVFTSWLRSWGQHVTSFAQIEAFWRRSSSILPRRNLVSPRRSPQEGHYI